MTVLWPYTLEAAREFGRLCTELRRAGRPLPQIDIPIAAIALTLGHCTVVTKDCAPRLKQAGPPAMR